MTGVVVGNLKNKTFEGTRILFYGRGSNSVPILNQSSVILSYFTAQCLKGTTIILLVDHLSGRLR